MSTATSTPAHRDAAAWLHRIACGDVDAETFFPAAESGPRYEAQVAAAKAVCARCGVRAECLAWALDALPFGVAGGMTEHERSDERTRRRGPRRKRKAPRPPVRGSRAEVAAAGRAAIRAGLAPRQVAFEFGVSDRTAQRWAVQVRARSRTESGTSVGAATTRGAA